MDDLQNLGMNLCQKYNQDSFLFKPPASEDNRAFFIDRTGNAEMTFGNVKVADMSQVYFTYLRKNQPSRRFSMTDDAGAEVEDKDLQESFRMYIPKSPTTFGEAKLRMGEIFMRVKKKGN